MTTATLRLARYSDIAALAVLQAQLYHAEAPGALRGPLDRQHALLRYVLEGDPRGLRRRYVWTDAHDTAIATASLQIPGDLLIGFTPPGTVQRAFALLGFTNALRLIGTLVRVSLASNGPSNRTCAYIHSVVVDERMRGQGIGHALMLAMEDEVRQHGVETVQLRVVVGNHGARRLYERLGYTMIGRTPRWLDWATFPTELMEKRLIL
ncbi:MAG TPA: GNAT family N-acetyltransferase [Roseiflexaceae bacterium]|jgi:GNAT superfamily N-acetyltransferase|nr:GNAT family N-acetyltransferase [Roseiflexaceae bacterium]